LSKVDRDTKSSELSELGLEGELIISIPITLDGNDGKLQRLAIRSSYRLKIKLKYSVALIYLILRL
jgi:hypothetical protein